MAGLMNSASPSAMGNKAAPVQELSAPDAPKMSGDGTQASPEEQAIYERFVGLALQTMYDDTVMPELIASMKSNPDIKQALADTAVSMIMRVYKASQEKGVTIPNDVLMAAGTEVFENMAELATAAKIHDFNSDSDAFEGAYYLAVDAVRLQLSEKGLVDQEGSVKELQEIDQSGGGLEELMGAKTDNKPQDEMEA